MAFRLGGKSHIIADTPEKFFNDLRSKKIPGLLAHQADILREYNAKALSSPDVAFQLPTGSGKTLVGLVLAEWRRRKFGERVVYLCPTNQLVHQVDSQSSNYYGIPVRVFTGSVSDYSAKDKSAYQNAESIAVTSYSALFNTNPFFNDPQIIILDDAHSAENYIANYWTLRIDKANHNNTFSAIVSMIRQYIPLLDYNRLTGNKDDLWHSSWVEKLPSPIMSEISSELISLLDEEVKTGTLKYSWSILRDHLEACHLYYDTKEILIRPLIPPTNTHSSFFSATQRVYMSATLGESGDLERVTGRSNIIRLPIPLGWDSQGTGRRLFLFPQRSLDLTDATDLAANLIRIAQRALYIVPSVSIAKEVKAWVETTLRMQYLDGHDLEEDKQNFVSSTQVVAVVANRYDGIDLANDECRLVIMNGLPRSVNLQEKFLVYRLGSALLLDDRIRTRIIQGFGRCTRSTTDYAAVLVLGEALNDYLLKRDRRIPLHPDIRAELEFGIEQSKEVDADAFKTMFNSLLKQDDDWLSANDAILQLREDLTASVPSGTTDLRKAVEYELQYQYALWNKDYETAFGAARSVLTELVAPELKGYRALWNYLAGTALFYLSNTNESRSRHQARSFFKNAANAIPGIRWLLEISREPTSTSSSDHDEDTEGFLATLIERLENIFEKLGTTNDRKYNKFETEIRNGLAERDSSRFEEAHRKLGELLGYNSGNVESQGSPDPWWQVDENLCFVFEDHSNAEPDSELDITKARQVMSHPNWIRTHLTLARDATIIPILLTPVTKAKTEALIYLQEVAYWNLGEFRSWAEQALSILRELRRTFPGIGDVTWRDQAASAYIQYGLAPSVLLKRLQTSKASESLDRDVSDV